MGHQAVTCFIHITQQFIWDQSNKDISRCPPMFSTVIWLWVDTSGEKIISRFDLYHFSGTTPNLLQFRYYLDSWSFHVVNPE